MSNVFYHPCLTLSYGCHLTRTRRRRKGLFRTTCCSGSRRNWSWIRIKWALASLGPRLGLLRQNGTTLEVGKRVVRWIWTIAGGNDAPVLTNASFLFFLSTPFFLPPFSSHLYSLLSFPPRFPSFLPSYFFFPRPFLLFRCVLASL